MLTIDANVFLSAAAPAEVFHADSDAFLLHVRQSGLAVVCPTLLLPEVPAGVMRPSGDAVAARVTTGIVRTFPNLRLVPVTEQRAQGAVPIALTLRLRGADSVYVAVAQEWGTTLITWDAEMLARAPSAVTVQTPAAYLTAQQGNNTV